MSLNKMISKAGSATVTVTVFLFAVFLIVNYSMGSYFVCLILPIVLLRNKLRFISAIKS